jgi:LysM repeat protein
MTNERSMVSHPASLPVSGVLPRHASPRHPAVRGAALGAVAGGTRVLDTRTPHTRSIGVNEAHLRMFDADLEPDRPFHVRPLRPVSGSAARGTVGSGARGPSLGRVGTVGAASARPSARYVVPVDEVGSVGDAVPLGAVDPGSLMRYSAPLSRAPQPGPVSRRTGPSAQVVRRRRFAVVLGVGMLTLTGVGVASASVGRSSAPTTEVHVVMPGESLWSIAREAKASGDVRPLVAKLRKQLGGGVLQPGDELIVPAA